MQEERRRRVLRAVCKFAALIPLSRQQLLVRSGDGLLSWTTSSPSVCILGGRWPWLTGVGDFHPGDYHKLLCFLMLLFMNFTQFNRTAIVLYIVLGMGMLEEFTELWLYASVGHALHGVDLLHISIHERSPCKTVVRAGWSITEDSASAVVRGEPPKHSIQNKVAELYGTC